MLVLRIENGTLEELVTQFGKKVYVEGVNPGSVILQSSFTYLAAIGIEQYCRELGVQMERLEKMVCGRAVVMHGVFALIEGC